MTYPQSAAVAAGQPTAASQYNHLRQDALYCGFDTSEAVPLASLLANYARGLNLSPLGSSRLRVTASPTAPVELMIDGCPCRASANVDLSAAAALSGSAAPWYIFAQRNPASTAFTLSANTSPTPAAGQRLIGSCYWDGSAIAAGSIVLRLRAEVLDALNTVPASLCGGRLCLSSGEPLATAERSSAVVYYSPYVSDVLQLYAPGYGWKNHAFSELSLELPAANNTNYDIFADWNGSAIALSSIAWASATARDESLSAQDGRWLLAANPLKLYLGSVRVGGAGVVLDTAKNRFVWNAFNAQPRLFLCSDSTMHTYTSFVWRYWNDDSSNVVQLLFGLQSPLQASLYGDQSGSVSGNPARAGIGVDTIGGTLILGSSTGVNFKGSVQYNNLAGPGLVALNLCETSHNSSTGTYNKAELSGLVWG